MIDSSGAVGDLVAVDGPIFFASELHKFHRDLANLADLDLERFFGGDVLVPAESASGLLTGDLVGRLRDHCVVRDHMIDLGDLVHGVAFDEQLILAERDQAAGFKAVETCASRRASTPTFRAARTIPFTPSAAPSLDQRAYREVAES